MMNLVAFILEGLTPNLAGANALGWSRFVFIKGVSQTNMICF